MNIGKDLIWESNDVKLLGITIDRDLKFDKHVLKLCSKANQKFSALSRMGKLLSFNKRRALFKAFVDFQFKYCPIVLMFHGRRSKKKINRLHERALRKNSSKFFGSVIWNSLPIEAREDHSIFSFVTKIK